eukprot:2504245-Rhodomonas_salina.2
MQIRAGTPGQYIHRTRMAVQIRIGKYCLAGTTIAMQSRVSTYCLVRTTVCGYAKGYRRPDQTYADTRRSIGDLIKRMRIRVGV